MCTAKSRRSSADNSYGNQFSKSNSFGKAVPPRSLPRKVDFPAANRPNCTKKTIVMPKLTLKLFKVSFIII